MLLWRCPYQANTRTKNSLHQADGQFFCIMKRREYFYFPLYASWLPVLNSLELIYTLHNFCFVTAFSVFDHFLDLSRVYKRSDLVDILLTHWISNIFCAIFSVSSHFSLNIDQNVHISSYLAISLVNIIIINWLKYCS